MFNEDVHNEVKNKIRTVAAGLFIKNGYDKTSVRDIARESGTNVAMINYYFGSKYNLFELIFNESLNELVDRIFYILNSDMPIFELTENWVDSYYDILLKYPQLPIFLMREINQDPEKLTMRIINRNPFDTFDKISHRIDKEIEEGRIQNIPSIHFLLNLLSLCVFPFVFGKLATHMAHTTQEEYENLLKMHKKYVVEFIIRALKP